MPRVKQKLDYEWRGLFFVDKDLDDFCGLPRHADAHLYETEYYAIENFIASPATLFVIWTDLLGLPITDSRFKVVSLAYDVAYQTFCEAMTSVMAWVIHLRRCKHRVALNDVSMDNLIALDIDCKCTLKPGWVEHILAASNTNGVNYDAGAHDTVVVELKSFEPKTYIRGKFDLWFFVSFIKKVIATLTEKVPGQSRVVYNVQITYKTAIDVLAPRLQPPNSLRSFMKKVLPE